ncbi:ImmA/IrrE family metallo-endopeptidase [Methylococcus sp. EFPC2]|uniref:ImmA/IrrE family metallo-endopeptidase n=1 Tax=Methylococcus sp. EFPC2 TaxID=2812648 RepID=UPI001967AAFE|nr:ImmA/IrrE family metallo-endopeptidase [Methylococcus sp. EFPC2]QSA98718.1 ImmA/IrrE family metallo-endopeptidase [Methylococcus sp. EFPC2]
MTSTHKPMQRLYQKLANVGYSKPYIHSLLPEWWDDAIADTPAGFQQASLLLSRLFSIQPESLWTEAALPALAVPDGCKFKQRANTQSHELDIACALARSAARLTLKAFKPEFMPGVYPDAAVLRRQLLEGKPWIAFQDLLAYCLHSGIPVIFLDHFPVKAKKMAGVSFEQDGRPVIVLTQRKPHGFLLFDLAHELGHIALGHTQGGAWVIDTEIDADAEDEHEQTANRYARELLTGSSDCNIVPAGRLYPQQLKTIANRIGAEKKIDPLHVALNYGHNVKTHFAVAVSAVKLIAENRPTDQETLIQLLLDFLDLDAMPEDDFAALKRLIGKTRV